MRARRRRARYEDARAQAAGLSAELRAAEERRATEAELERQELAEARGLARRAQREAAEALRAKEDELAEALERARVRACLLVCLFLDGGRALRKVRAFGARNLFRQSMGTAAPRLVACRLFFGVVAQVLNP